MKRNAVFACLFAVLGAGCDLRPRIAAIPDSVGDFISARYPALLADPVSQAEIYNSAATDYGVYAAPELYGYGDAAAVDDYVLYASVDDYIVPPVQSDGAAAVPAPSGGDGESMDVENANVGDAGAGDVSDAAAMSDEQTVADAPVIETATVSAPAADDFIVVPMYGGVMELVTVSAGDTLYSIAKRNNTSVDELIAANNLTEPYTLRVGQTLRLVADKNSIVVSSRPSDTPVAPAPTPAAPQNKTPVQTLPTPAESAPKIPVPVQTAPKPTTPTQPIGNATTTRVDVTEITVTPGDTLYSISRKYSVPVNDLAVMNNLVAPFALYAGQKVRVPNLAAAPVKPATAVNTAAPKTTSQTAATTTQKTAGATTTTNSSKKDTPKPSVNTKTNTAPTTQPQKEKISSDPSKKLPTISARSSSKFSWPVRGAILSGYGAKPNGLVNDGINISASRGTTVKAAENGVVAYAGNEVKGMGNLIIIQHSDGFMTVYAHMDSMVVRRGAKVAVGQKIGTVGQTGKVDKPQLHFEIRKGTKSYNPTQYLKK